MIHNEILKMIKKRRSIRGFKNEQIQDEELQAVLEAGIYAPNAGDQAWHFTVIQNKKLLDKLNLTAKEAAKQMDIGGIKELGSDENFNCLYGAPTLIIVSGKETSPIPLEADCAAAIQNMLLAAEAMGLGSCWIHFVLFGFYSPQRTELQKELKIPEGYRPYYSAVFGYKKEEGAEAAVRKPNLITYIR